MLARLSPFFLLLSVLGAALSGAPVRDQYVTAELIAQTRSIQPGETFTVGLRLSHDPKWHTYWKASATGYATSLTWDLPEGFVVGDLQWPVPGTYETAGIIDFVYEGTVVLPLQITAPADLEPGISLVLKARADWLMCADICVPGGAELTLSLPVLAESPAKDPRHMQAFAETAAHLPLDAPPSPVTAWRDGDSVFLALTGNPPADLYFFDTQHFIEPVLNQKQTRGSDGSTLLELKVDSAGVGEVERLRGVLATTSGNWIAEVESPGVELDLAWADGPPAGFAINPADALDVDSPGLLGLIGLAFVGGLILNLMPCVFPVIGIKIMGFVNQAGEASKKVVLHGLLFAAGVLVSFWILAGVLLILRSGGEQLGWGFQLQDPVFVFLLTVFLFVFALNMSGVFEIGTSAMNLGSGLSAQSGLTGSFFSGVLATVVATPCAAPFLAPALGAALTLPPVASLTVFTAIGIGLAAPYLVLSAFPRLTRFLPRPGAWMETFKQFMAFLLYGTAGVLLWVLVGQLVESEGYTPFALLNVIFALIVAALAAWVYGRWAAPHRTQRVRRTAYIATALLAASALALGYPSALAKVDWQKWEPGKAEQLAAEGNIVYVDFTARWCVTCQTNKAAVFQSNAVKAFFKRPDVVALKADWTNRDATIAEALAAFDRSAVPFNLIYAPGLEAPILLPELLTPGIVLSALEQASGQ